ncbi:unnamed protein product, partial [Effrenium voratum]
TWKERPRRFVEPPLVTHIQCLGFSQAITKERKTAKPDSDAAAERLGPAMTQPNRQRELQDIWFVRRHVLDRYFTLFTKTTSGPASRRPWRDP